ncbi:hypothetical protein DIZ81_00370 [Legionella taurinensis]|uniref:Coiled-coil protein n=1 Tax=Legionella taurinensis TaxID=70611 RepID=A0A3A5LJK8_9GAMM|nr:hypothetical protein [Legionella taurinensis]MDX1836671.1 hypothetical protein [Legionella taurinensis]PUT42874.1 hypothetical protein DB744_00375 [Legionella taurinensis]PUT45429.1 hypothetical protein DB746_00375 [Legionella taurinensis]PUT46996.1 hypothetical protein DB743_03625 [Legionella taurinensis]PUT49196.1 hypothetical protein DB745_00375 [Legionella taurinensis]
MARYRIVDGTPREVIPLQIKPAAHQEIPSITGSIISPEAGAMLYGYYSMDYRLPGGDMLRLLANHNQKTVQILLLTGDAQKLKQLPGTRQASLVANAIASIHRYCIRSESYSKPRTAAQLAKFNLAKKTIQRLSRLLPAERAVPVGDWAAYEALRHQVITLIEACRAENRLLTTNPVLSEGWLETILYEARQEAQHFELNRVFPVSRLDQLDFTEVKSRRQGKATTFIWDSDIHIGHNEQALHDTLSMIGNLYGLLPASSLTQVPANRFKRLETFLYKLWNDGHHWINHLASRKKLPHTIDTDNHSNGLSVLKIKPYYSLGGIPQRGYANVAALVHSLTGAHEPGKTAPSLDEAQRLLTPCPNGSWVLLDNQSRILIRVNDDWLQLNYFEEDGLVYPLPHGEDLFTLSQLSKQHLYLPEKFKLHTRAFFSKIPLFFSYFFNSLKTFTQALQREFHQHVHEGHVVLDNPIPAEETRTLHPLLNSLQDILNGHGLLATGQTLEEFVREKIANSPYVVVREQHRPSPPAYDNPLHRSFHVLRHIAGFFVDTSERNPLVGTLAMAAYLYGGCAVLAPKALTAVLTKLHLHGLIRGIEPTQALGHWMSHGPTSEAISAAVTYWQGIIVGGDLDQFFIKAVSVLHEEPAEVAIIVALALGLGYGLSRLIPSLQEEMGEFPYPNYAAIGAKGGAAIYDTVMYPGDDWLLGSLKWLLKTGLSFAKIMIAPFVEASHYGYREGFLPGLKKSGRVTLNVVKRTVAALLDLVLAVLTIPFLEISALFIHVPFSGLTNLVSKTMAYLGNWQILGQVLLDFAERPSEQAYLRGFRLSPLYGFSSPFGLYHDNKVLNVLCNAGMLFLWPPVQVLKNLLVLPFIDGLSFFARAALIIINPASRFTAYVSGQVLVKAGLLWDNSIGLLFQGAAWLTLSCSNLLSTEASEIRLSCLELLQTVRHHLHHWAFHPENHEEPYRAESYFLEEPLRFERLPHQEDDCLMKMMLNKQQAATLPLLGKHPLRSPPQSRNKQALSDDESETLLPPQLFSNNPAI